MINTLQIEAKGLNELIVEMVKGAVREETKKIFITPQELKGKLINRSEAAELLGVSFVTLNRYDKLGMLKPRKIGGRVMYSIIDVNCFLTNNSN